ncbi:LysE family translocator [Caulobacter mirabilis]|uniref:Lysine transporter LysE n=1 Tax=Caulobacter mirabilis TaxID=69666 RepID=A0A2D2B251_9CAUL|nr:LysE family translocator [Caulobacter mirabilis]ATQ44343.1 lysine transporter LysE [Caulobacter mirabilis]
MTLTAALLSFTVAGALLAVTPGLDTALVLRTAAVDGPRKAVLATLGILTGCLIWGAAVAVGLGALLTASQTAFMILKWCGAAYLAWLGIGLLLKPRKAFEIDTGKTPLRRGSAFARGLMTNLLNPKVGVFYVSFLPQFVPEGAPAGPFIFALAAAQGLMGTAWLLTLVAATRPIAGLLKRPAVVTWLDRVTGGVFLAFAARLATART